jgi:hypothetical protein
LVVATRTAVPPVTVDRRDVVKMGLADARSVQCRKMIAFAIGIEREFPVGLGGQNPLLNRHRPMQFQRFDDIGHRPEMRSSINWIAAAWPHKDQPQIFGAGQFQQVARANLAAFETLLRRLSYQLAYRIEGPSVKGASHACAVIGIRFAFLDQLGATMRTHVAESARRPVLAARHDDRRACGIKHQQIPRMGNIARKSGDDGLAKEQLLPLGFKPQRIGIDAFVERQWPDGALGVLGLDKRD